MPVHWQICRQQRLPVVPAPARARLRVPEQERFVGSLMPKLPVAAAEPHEDSMLF